MTSLFIWEHGEEKLINFVEILNEIHPTIKFTPEWSQKSINFLDVTVSLIDCQIEMDLCVKPIDSHQYLHSSLCHPYHCKKNIPYSQVLRLNNRICSENNFFDIHCNNLEKWLSDKGYSETLVRNLKTLQSFWKSCIFYLHQMSSIGKFLQIFPE